MEINVAEPLPVLLAVVVPVKKKAIFRGLVSFMEGFESAFVFFVFNSL